MKADPEVATEGAGLARVRAEIVVACREAGRDPAGVSLIAISKTVAIDRLLPVLAQGQRVFGENRVQEARAKWPALRAQFPDLELHLVGPLQSNKARDAVGLFDLIHSVDRDSLCEALAAAMERLGRRPRLLMQVNTGAEPQKAGVLPEAADGFLARCREVHGLNIEGLMCIPPIDEPPAPHFALLAKMAARHHLPLLSMGMSADFRLAIMFGATHVRVGSAIFGSRPT